MMDSSTQQLAHKVALGLAAFMLSVAFLFILAVAWQQGDGAAREMVGLLQPTIITTFGGLLTYLTVTAGVNAWVAVKTAGTVQQIPAAGISPVSVPVAVPAAPPATAAVAPAIAPQPAPTPVAVVPAVPSAI